MKQRADEALRASMDTLVGDMGMLTGLTVCYGTGEDAVTHSTGLRQEVLYDGGFVEAPLPIASDTIYDIASLTKVFTLVSVLQLMERGQIREGDDIAALDPRFLHLEGCSVADTLSYLACLKTPERVDAQADAATAEYMVFQTRQVPHEGERLYSDMNALVLKYVVAAVSGMSFWDYLQRHVLAPAGMQETWARVPAARARDLMNYNYEHRIMKGAYSLIGDAQPGSPHDPKARLLGTDRDPVSGHAGLFATAGDMVRFAQALLTGRLIKRESLQNIGINRTGYLLKDGSYRQFLGQLVFTRSPIQRFSEVPEWMGLRAFGISGYTGNHFALDPDRGVFDLILGNRCHNRLSQVMPAEDSAALGLSDNGSGSVSWPDGRQVRSSFGFIHQKDRMLHNPVRDCMLARGWLKP